jgi:glucose/arabinose dehydrogenase
VPRRAGKLVLLASAAVAAAGLVVGACRWLLPERYAVNAPLGQMLFGRGSAPPPPSVLQRRVQVPPGLAISVYADGLPNARMLRFTPAGDLLVSQPREGRVVLLERDADGDGQPDAVQPLLEGLNRPHGMDFNDGWLYVAEADAVARIRFDAETRRAVGPLERVVTGLPAGGNHWTRSLRFGPDGWMYVSVGSSCNACIDKDPRRAAILRFRPDGSGGEIYATGLRNAVGFDWRPGTGEMYATDNGRDLLGDDFPPCELDRIEPGGFYGWPFANGNRVPDPDLGAGHEDRIRASIPPVHAFRAHNAPLGMIFLRSPEAPAGYRGAALVALHGSWNRTRKDGYRVVSLHWNASGEIAERPFATGFLENEDVIGRPVDVAEGPDGAIYVSDDFAGAVYRIAATGAAASGGRGKTEERGASTAPSPGRAPDADPLAGLSPEERHDHAARGRALYEGLACSRCHDPDHSEPGVVPVPLSDLSRRYDLASLTSFLAAPTPPMPSFELDESARRDLAIYLLGQ